MRFARGCFAPLNMTIEDVGRSQAARPGLITGKPDTIV
jgi:hypothetical protein